MVPGAERVVVPHAGSAADLTAAWRAGVRLPEMIALVTCLATIAGCTGKTDSCGEELSREELLSIVEAEKAKLWGGPPPQYEREVTIDSEGCDYVYFEQRLPYAPGGHLLMRIDRHGKVIEYIPGL